MRSSSGEYLLRSASKKQGSIGRAGKATWPPGAAGAAAALEDAAIQSGGGTQTGAQCTRCVAFFVILIFSLSLFLTECASVSLPKNTKKSTLFHEYFIVLGL